MLCCLYRQQHNLSALYSFDNLKQFTKMASYSDKLKDPRWQKKRLEILERDNWTCQCCNDTKKTLNVHHMQYKRMPWSVPNDKLITYCEDCHQSLEGYNKSMGDIKMMKYIFSKTMTHVVLFSPEKVTYGYFLNDNKEFKRLAVINEKLLLFSIDAINRLK